MDKNKVCIIRAKLKKDYVFDAMMHYGYPTFTPYKGKNLFTRILREIWFRGKLPNKQVWYNRAVLKMDPEAIVLYDPLILPEYIEWLHMHFPDARIILSYENRANTTIHPDSVGEYVEKWSYDPDDCQKYHMRYLESYFFTEYIRTPKENPKYDVLYVGRDKGRADYLHQIEDTLKQKDLKTYFHICADRQYLRFKKKFYKKLLVYDEYLDLLVDSRAILNIVPEGQKSITQREMEAAFDGIKCITNNKGIMEFDLYDPSIYFVLDYDDINDINIFIHSKVKKHPDEIIKSYDFDYRFQAMLNGKE